MQRYFTILVLILLIFSNRVLAQFDNPIVIPDTLSGSEFLLKMGNSSKEILPGSATSTYTYNSFPYLGPTLIMRKDSMVMAMVSNLIDDTTTLHWHGLHIPAHADGGPHSPILPGMEWEAHFECKDPAGTNWYHPHFHGKTAEQTLKGAAGLIIVRDAEEATLAIPRTYGIDDIPLVIQSLQLDPDNQFLPAGQQDSIVLVNGVHLPFAKVPAQVVRLRILNASNARNFNLGFSDDRAFSVIGTDGSLLGTPVSLTRVRIAPGERLEILVNLIGLEGLSTIIKSFGSEIPPGTHGGPTIIMPVGSPPNHSPLDGTDFSIMELKIQPPLPGALFVIPETLVHQSRYLESQSTFDRTIVFSSVVPGSAAGPFLLNDSTFNM
ncbi:MAG TPA: multicopper oxidase domain-containing protein, partial [Catalimonadaceae bacterium]|nr:multicopper oxidase domain-containing protein [Catalimonadaceae bacterium]